MHPVRPPVLSVSPDPAANLPSRAEPSRVSGADGAGSDDAFASLIEPALDRDPAERSQARSATADDRARRSDREPARDSAPASQANGTTPDHQPHASGVRKPASRGAEPDEKPNEKISEKTSETTAAADDKGKTAETAAEFGLRVDVQPETAAVGPLVDALAEHAARLRAEGALPPPRKKSRRR